MFCALLCAPTAGVVTTLAGNGLEVYADGIGTDASFNRPEGLAISPNGATLYVADRFNRRIRAITVATRKVISLAGTAPTGYADGVGVAARFADPMDVAVSPDGTILYVPDYTNNRIRKVRATCTETDALESKPLDEAHLKRMTPFLCVTLSSSLAAARSLAAGGYPPASSALFAPCPLDAPASVL